MPAIIIRQRTAGSYGCSTCRSKALTVIGSYVVQRRCRAVQSRFFTIGWSRLTSENISGTSLKEALSFRSDGHGISGDIDTERASGRGSRSAWPNVPMVGAFSFQAVVQ